jgi:predicted HicB family RNase H-like nuclease
MTTPNGAQSLSRLSHRGYTGTAEIDWTAGIIFGRVALGRDVVTFQGSSVAEAKQAFADSVDDYLEWCEEDGNAPEGPKESVTPC